HPEVGLVLLPFYLAVAAVYGALAYFTDSTLPSMVLHAGGNMFSAFDLFTRGRSEWQLSAAPNLSFGRPGPIQRFGSTWWPCSSSARWLQRVRLATLGAFGHDVQTIPPPTGTFGHGQAVMRVGAGVRVGASEPRHDGAAISEGSAR